MPTDFYELLGVSSDATDGEIRRAFRRKVKEYHPDVNDHPRAHAQFKVLKKAKEVLLNPTERGAYDRLGHREYLAKRLQGELPATDFPDIDGRHRNQSPTGSDSEPPTDTSTRSDAGRGRVGFGRRQARSTVGTSGARVTASQRSNTSGRPVVGNRIIRNLWAGVLAVVLSYLVSLGVVIGSHRATIDVSAIRSLIGLATTDPSMALERATAERFGFPVVTDGIATFQTGAVTGDMVTVLVGAIVMPIAYAGAIYLLRRRTVWNASWGYVIAGSGPLVGIALNVAGIAVLPIDVVLYAVFPTIAILVFLYHRFR